MAPARPGLLLLLLLLLRSAESLAASGLKEDEEEKVVCPAGQYVVNGSCETCPEGTYTDQSNSWTKCKPCDQECSINEELMSKCSSSSNRRCQCIKGYFKDSDHTEACTPCSSCGNCTVLTQCSPTSDTVCGSTGNRHRNHHIGGVLMPLFLGPVALGVCLYLSKRGKITLKLDECLRRQPQGSTKKQDGTHRRNSSEIQNGLKDTENGQCNPEERHSLLLEGVSGSSPNSADSVVLELPPQNGTPGTPLPIAITQ